MTLNNTKNLNRNAYAKRELVDKYEEAVFSVGLWMSEKHALNKFVPKASVILDIACGAGRTTLGMFNMGYSNIVGLDFSHKMIQSARTLTPPQIEYVCSDILNMPFQCDTFDAVFASYNALMMIPKNTDREKAFFEINRVLKRDGLLLFTASDRNHNVNYRSFWEAEKQRWLKNECRDGLYDFGDQIFTECGNQVFVHFTTKQEVEELLKKTRFTLLDNYFRDEFDEPKEVKLFSGDTMFYIAQKVD